MVVTAGALVLIDFGEFDFRVGAEVGDEGVHGLAARVVAEEVLDLVMDVDQRLGAAGLFVGLVDDVVTELGRDDAGDLAFLHFEGALVEFGDHHAGTEPAERTALLTRRAVGVLLGLFGEVTAVHDALADLTDLHEGGVLLLGQIAVVDLDEDVLAEDLGSRDVLLLVGFVELGDLLFGRIIDVGAGLVDEHVDAGTFLELLAEGLFGDALGLEGLLVVLFAADLRDDAGDFGIDVLRRDGEIELVGAVEEELRADGLVKGLFLELGEVGPHFIDRHAVARVEPNEAVEFEVNRIGRNGLSVDNRSLHHVSLFG